MKLPAFVLRRLHWINLPTLTLLTLLQRTPVVRTFIAAGDFVLSSPLGNVLKSTLATAVTLGALNSRAGATEVTASPSSPAHATVGVPFGAGFGTLGTQSPPDSWTAGGNVPPGLEFSGESGPNLILSGTPTTPGTYTMSVVGDTVSYGSTPALSYVVVVSAAANTAPAITTQPQGQTVQVGANVTLTAAASGAPTPTLQWQKNGANISGATSATLSLSNVQAADSGSYTLVATNSAGTATSNAAVLTVSTVAPTIAMQPQSHAVTAGATAVLEVQATGGTLTYQWKKDGVALVGATSSRLIITGAQGADAGSYTVVVSGTGVGTVTSAAATLSVNTSTNPGHLVNLSVRGFVGTGNQVLIMGFVTGGDGTSGSTSLLARAVGPSVIPLGVTDAITDPTLALIPQGAPALASNDNWGGTTALKNAFAATGAFALLSDSSKDAALVQDFPRNVYSVVISDTAGATGSVVAELYDAGAALPYNPATPRLVNISARGYIGANGSIIPGFVIQGDTALTVLVRAIGPNPDFATALGSGNISDPILYLYRARTGGSDTIYVNDNWGGDPQLTAVGTRVGASPLSDPASKDAAILITLDPGVYSAGDFGVNGATGITLVEVYAVP